MTFVNPTDAELRELLESAHRIAVVGLSDKIERPSFGVAAYLKANGFEVVPVNPTIESAVGEPAVDDLSEVAQPIDIVDVFRRAEHCAEIARSAVQAGARAIWLQEGIVNEEAMAIAREGGLLAVTGQLHPSRTPATRGDVPRLAC